MKKVIIVIALTILAFTTQAQNYSFDRVVKEQHYMGATVPVSDTFKTGIVVISDYTIVIETEGENSIIIENVKPQLFNSNELLQPFTDGTGKRYFLDHLNQQFIILDIGFRTTYRLRTEF